MAPASWEHSGDVAGLELAATKTASSVARVLSWRTLRVVCSFAALFLVSGLGCSSNGAGGGSGGRSSAGSGGGGGREGTGGLQGSGGVSSPGGVGGAAGGSGSGGSGALGGSVVSSGSGGSAGTEGGGSGGAHASGGGTAGGGSAGSTSSGRGGQSGAAGAQPGGAGGNGAAGRAGAGGAGGLGGATAARPLEQVQREYIDLRFGMFIHFGILTYTGSWSQANLPIQMFNPTNLNPAQWADAAVAAKMKYAVLTAKHHDGFALWNTSVSTFDVGNIAWRDGQGDVVRDYVDAFRAKGLLPGLYYSVWDNTQGIGNGPITRAQIDYVKRQLTELLTNYGPIPIIVFDGWSWKMGHRAVPYQEIRELVKSLQPNCLMLDHTHLMSPWNADVAAIEEPKGAFVPADNTFPATQGQKINATGGNDWFWAPDLGSLMSVSDIVAGHLALLEPRYTNFLLNCPPNRDGLMPAELVSRLSEVGRAWSPNTARAPLPAQGPQNERPYTPAGATSTSGTAANAIDGQNDWGYYTVWESSGALPQSITIDLGARRPDVGILTYVPRYVANQGPQLDGAVTAYRILVSTDGTTFDVVGSGSWPLNGKMKVATFGPVAASHVRFEATEAMGGKAAATEITVGGRP